jgi:hypothetical protein
MEDYGAQVLYNSNGSPPKITYDEGVFVDYKFFDKNNVEPRFPFGFGLSYTTFQYSDLSVTGSVGDGSAETGPGSSLDPWFVNFIPLKLVHSDKAVRGIATQVARRRDHCLVYSPKQRHGCWT